MTLKDFIEKGRMAAEEAYMKGNLKPAEQIYATDFIMHSPPFPDRKGFEAFKQTVAAVRQAYSNIRLEINDIIGENNTVALRFTMSMKHTGISQQAPIPPTGKDVVLQGSIFFHLKDGKIIEGWWHHDYLGFFHQLGIVQLPGNK
jgi:predicted ester cyclase